MQTCRMLGPSSQQQGKQNKALMGELMVLVMDWCQLLQLDSHLGLQLMYSAQPTHPLSTAPCGLGG